MAEPLNDRDAPAPANHDLRVGDDIVASNTHWSFGGSTPDHFDRHVSRSVPLYEEGHRLIASLAGFFLRPQGLLIDVGCSTGSLIRNLAATADHDDARFVGFDIESDMVRVARNRCQDLQNVTVQQGFAESIDYTDADVVVMYYTLQFLRPGQRRRVLARIFDGLNEGGALFLFEKVVASDPQVQDILHQAYHDYKAQQGFNLSEIFSKAKSLRSVMAPQRAADNHLAITDVGFRSVTVVQRYLCFEGVLAIK